MTNPDYDPFDNDEAGSFEEPPYNVGYGRPPVNRRFGAGPDENPRYRKGKRKGTKNRNTHIRKILKERHTLTIDRQKRRMTLLEALFYKLRDMALKGNIRALKLLEDYTGHGDEYKGPTAILFVPETLPVEQWLNTYGPDKKYDPLVAWYHGSIPPPEDDPPP